MVACRRSRLLRSDRLHDKNTRGRAVRVEYEEVDSDAGKGIRVCYNAVMLALIKFFSALTILVASSRYILLEVSALARHVRVPAFGASVLVLGFFTSLTELGVAINAQIDGHPEIYAGNLMGGAFLIVAFIIPILTLLRGGLPLSKHVHTRMLLMFSVLTSVPLLCAFDGVITRLDAGLMIAAWLLFFFENSRKAVERRKGARGVSLKRVAKGLAKIGLMGAAIYVMCGYLVTATEGLAVAVGIPAFIVSVLMLAVGTNIPELALAVHAVRMKRADIAFGDYIGSVAMNTLIFGVFAMINGTFTLAVDGFVWLLPAFLVMHMVFLGFVMSKRKISVAEAAFLVSAYGAFVLHQAIVRL